MLWDRGARGSRPDRTPGRRPARRPRPRWRRRSPFAAPRPSPGSCRGRADGPPGPLVRGVATSSWFRRWSRRPPRSLPWSSALRPRASATAPPWRPRCRRLRRRTRSGARRPRSFHGPNPRTNALRPGTLRKKAPGDGSTQDDQPSPVRSAPGWSAATEASRRRSALPGTRRGRCGCLEGRWLTGASPRSCCGPGRSPRESRLLGPDTA